MSVAIVLGVVGVVLWLYFVWSRRRFYYFAWKVPGPGGWPLVGIALRLRTLDDFLPELLKMSSEYNSNTGFAWVGPLPFVATKDPVLIEKILTSPDCLNKPQMYDCFIKALGGGLLTISSPKCTAHRKLLNPAFNHHILLSFFDIFNEGTSYLIKEFDKLAECGAFDLSAPIYGCTLRISIETTMGMDGEEYRERSVNLLPHTKIVLTTTMNRLLHPWLHLDSIFRLTDMYKPYIEAKKVVNGFVNEVIDKKLALQQNTDSETKSSSMENNNKYSDESDDNVDIKKSRNIFIEQAIEMYRKNLFDWNDFFGESSSMIYAAFETTATTLHTIFIMLAMHPQYQERLFEEVLSAFPDKDCEVTYDDFPKLVYMDMVINESFRIAATVPVIARHANGDLFVSKDLSIPKGMQFVIDIFNMHRDPNIWGPKATSFNPDNFLPENLANKHPYAFIPFSKGPRNCLGWRYATMLLKVVLARVVRNFRFSTSFPFDDLHYVVNLTLKFKEIPHLEVHRR